MTSQRYKPKNYPSVAPYLSVIDAEATIKFLLGVLDARELRKFVSPGGRVAHAELQVDDSVIMLTEGGGSFPAVASHVHVYVADVDSVYARAIQFGAVAVQKPIQQDDEDKRCGVSDGGGITWWISTKMG